jgi:1-acyl-sn-glycerol-3-phosphate acyltransferase
VSRFNMPAGGAWALLIKAPLVVLSTVVMGSLSVIVSFFDRPGRVTDRIARAWARSLLAIGGVRVRMSGMEHIEPGGRYVFAGNHLSLMDTPVVLSSVPNRFLFLVAAKYVRLPFLGTHLRRCGHFSVDPDDTKSALRVMTLAAGAVRERGLSILVFPEGTRSRGEMGEFKEGAVYIAIKAGVPIVPFAIRGTREVLPVGSIRIRGGEVDLVFGAPIATEGCTLRDRARLNGLLTGRVAALAGGATAPRRKAQTGADGARSE